VTPSIAIVGPSSPRELAIHLTGADRKTALAQPGLGGRPVNNLVSALIDAGTCVELVTLAPELTDCLALQGPRLSVLAAPYRARHRARDLFRAERRHIERLLAQTSAPVVAAQWTYEFALGALTRGHRPTLVVARDLPLTILRYSPDPYRIIRTLLAAATRMRATQLVANSPYTASAWRRQMLYRREIPVVPNVVMPATAASNGSSDNRAPVILDVTEHGRLKNAHSLIRAMTAVLSAYPEARLRLVGPGLTRSSPEAQLADRLGVGHAIEFRGRLDGDKVAAEYATATIFVHPALEESFGMTVGEAMSHGLPVIGGVSAGAVPWLLDHGRAGLLVDARYPEAIAAAVCRLIGEPTLRDRLAAAALRRVQETFSPSVIATQWLRLCDDARSTRR
jgi:glycosyltransferase involved in cell wall biosynthesis